MGRGGKLARVMGGGGGGGGIEEGGSKQEALHGEAGDWVHRSSTSETGLSHEANQQQKFAACPPRQHMHFTSLLFSQTFSRLSFRKRVSSVVECSSTNSKVHGSIPVPYCMVMDYDEACIVHLSPGVVHNFLKDVDV